MSGVLRRAAKAPLLALLAWKPFRKRAVFELRKRWFSDLGFEVPCGGIVVPIPEPSGAESFAEIFVEREYGDLLEVAGVPGRWLDLGCHTGCFTLWLAAAAMAKGKPWAALLVDAAPHMPALAASALERNGFGDRARAIHGAICGGQLPPRFLADPGMGSRVETGGGDGIPVPPVSQEDILAAFPPPYDLIKLDIEGAEWAFFGHYQRVAHGAKRIVLEWHLPSGVPDPPAEARRRLESAGFEHERRLRDTRRCRLLDGSEIATGVDLFRQRG